jgi:hypothetical protein
VEELNQRHGVGVIPADKIGKEHFINLMNTEFITRKILILPQANELAEEFKTLVWETDGGRVKVSASGARREHPGLPNHLCDAALYLWRHAYTYLYEVPKAPVDWASQSRWEGEHIKRLEEQVRKDQNPNELDLVFDEDLFDFASDPGV